MYTEGMADLNEMILNNAFFELGEPEITIPQIKEKAKTRYFPAFEKVGGSSFTFRGTKAVGQYSNNAMN